MKPLNLDNRPCSPVSSNCVVWQGPDIPCINLCKGDTVSDVVAALATELCTILDQLNVSNYDLSCLGITACGPKDFQALIQLLIDKICDAEGIVRPDLRIEPGCPDCVVTVAECFRTGNNTTMQLLDYVNMIAEKVCALIDEIANINQQIDEIIIRIENLENAPVPVTPIPSFTLGCTIGSLGTGTTQFINVILQEFINNVWCPLQNTLGSNSDLISAVSAICIQDTDLQLSTGTPFSTNPNWIQSGSYDTVADAINNLWVALCDVYNAFGNVSIAVQDTNSIDLTFTGNTLSANIVDTGWVDLLGFSWYAGAIADPNSSDFSKPQCRRIGNVIYFRGTVMVPLADIGSGGVPLLWTFGPGVDSYYTNTTVVPSTGAEGVTLNTNGSLAFNNAQRVIPPSVLGVGFNVDASYGPGTFSIGSRTVPTKTETSTALITLFKPIITTTGLLLFQLPKDVEQGRLAPNGTDSFFTSPLNNVISNVISGQFVPKYNPPNVLHSSPVSGVQTREVTYDATLTYPFTCNAASEQQVGGFQTRIDGLQVFVAPCNTDIKPYVCN
jgi:hypothetical protein